MADGVKPLRNISESFKELAATANSQTLEMEVGPFSNACAHVSVLFSCLGIAFKFAEMDYVAKVVDLQQASKSFRTLKSLLDHDIEHNTVRKGGSHSRNLLRVKRGLDMVRVLFEKILVSEGNSLKEPASTAYAQVFAPHHGWAIRKAVAAGIICARIILLSMAAFAWRFTILFGCLVCIEGFGGNGRLQALVFEVEPKPGIHCWLSVSQASA